MHIFFYHFGLFAPEYTSVPLRTVRHLSTILKRVTTLGGCKARLSHTHTLVKIFHLWVSTHIAYQHYFIHGRDILKFRDEVTS